ncbi:MAG: hypothetical protein A2W31_12275 [Planctomycetes bacterium RBG_16_64_10]|nr:MAG: hypothetical protein A2W31_12275 [Planctomycetes bacterium RBG_16_64_10]
MRCPICGRLFDPHQTTAMPFCSVRCRSVDLGRWIDGRYCVSLAGDSEGEPHTDDRTHETP